MAINPASAGVHHISLRCGDPKRTKDFYQNILGLPLVLDTPDLFGFTIGTVFLGFKIATPKFETVFNPLTLAWIILPLPVKGKAICMILPNNYRMPVLKYRRKNR